MLTQAINQMKADYGEKFDIEHINLAPTRNVNTGHQSDESRLRGEI